MSKPDPAKKPPDPAKEFRRSLKLILGAVGSFISQGLCMAAQEASDVTLAAALRPWIMGDPATLRGALDFGVWCFWGVGWAEVWLALLAIFMAAVAIGQLEVEEREAA